MQPKENPEVEGQNDSRKGQADFETAIEAAGFGVFNILLLLVSLPAAVSSVFETSTMSYVLPSAECDIKLTLLDKGMLNAVTYAGMIAAAIPWGYIADTQGRKRILVVGYLLDCLCVLGSAFSRNVTQLMIFKFFGGFVACGPFAVLMSYVTEIHGKTYRPRILMVIGMKFSVAALLLPVLALLILPNTLELHLMGFSFYTWQIFLAISAIPSLISGLFFMLFPESPKFLMSQGRNAEALESFRIIYSLNKRKPKEAFPITELVNELPEKCEISTINGEIDRSAASTEDKGKSLPSRSIMKGFQEGCKQLRPLFQKPYLGLSLLVYIINFAILLGQNSMRLWLPQLFASINEYKELYHDNNPSMCTIIDYSVNKTNLLKQSHSDDCEVIITIDSYSNNIVVALTGFVGYIIAGTVINALGVKKILILGLMIASACGILLYWSLSPLITLMVSAIYVTMGSICSTSVLSASLNLFPTSLRTMIVSVSMMIGRTGSLAGNVLFPTLMTFGCIFPFLMVSLSMICGSLLSIFLPGAKNTALK